jgi:hypothetical protein
VHQARDKALAQATVEGRGYVVTADPHRVKSADQAKALGRSLLWWCAQRSAVEKVLPGVRWWHRNYVRTPEHLLQDIVDSWLEHGNLSIVARRQKARQPGKYQRMDRSEKTARGWSP